MSDREIAFLSNLGFFFIFIFCRSRWCPSISFISIFFKKQNLKKSDTYYLLTTNAGNFSEHVQG